MRSFVIGLISVSITIVGMAHAQVIFSPNQLNFGATYVGVPSAVQSATLTNAGAVVVLLTNQALIGTAGLSVQSTNCPFSNAASTIPFAPGASCVMRFQFTPQILGPESARTGVQLTDTSFQPLGTAALAFSGTGLFPLTVSPAELNFGSQLENPYSAPILPLTLTNSGAAPLTVSFSSSNPDFGLSPCSPSSFFMPAGASCVINVSFAPTATGADTGSLLVGAAIYGGQNRGQGASVPLSGFGHPLNVTSNLNLGLVLLGTSSQSAVNVFNSSNAPVIVSAVTVSGGQFAKDNGCVGTLAPRSFCAVNVTFTPSAAGVFHGTLTLFDGDPTSPQTVPLTGSATALQVKVENSGFQNTFPFLGQPLLTTSPPQTVTLTNVGKVPVSFQTALNGLGFTAPNTCKSSVPAFGSCTISAAYRPTQDGINRGTLTITPADPIGAQMVTLLGEGVGIANLKIRLHYDYMVAPNHTHDPEAVSPGAVQRVIDAFARHGVELIVDPHHTAIPEVRVVTFSSPGIVCPNSEANFYDLRSQYFSPKFPDEHYAIFAHFSTDAWNGIGCAATQSGEADLPGLNFVVSL